MKEHNWKEVITEKKKINKQDIEKYYYFLNHKLQSELRFISPRWKDEKAKPIQEWASNINQFIFLCEKYNGDMNLYVGLNERKPLGDKDEDIEFITNIGHDIDAHEGGMESFMKAQETALKIKEDCMAKGYNEPMVICSGRGFWVVHHISPLKNTEENHKKIKEFGKFIKNKYEIEGIEVDSSVYNPSRIARIPGTLNISDKENQVMSFIANSPENKEDLSLSETIKKIELPKIDYTSSGETPKSSCAFMDYCLTHEIPKGERHQRISRNMAIYLSKHPDRELLKEQYFKVQKGSETELDQWLKSLDDNPEKKYPFSCGELINFQRKYKIPLKCKGCPKFEAFKKEEKAKKQLEDISRIEKETVQLRKDGKYLFSEFGRFTDYLSTARDFIKVQPIYYDKYKIWWLWDIKDSKWNIVDETDLMIAIDDNTKHPTTDTKTKYEILEALKRIGRRNKPKESKKTWIQFKNTIVDIENGKVFKASPEFFITNPIPWKIGDKEDTPIMDKIFEEWMTKEGFQDKSFINTLYEIMAYTLMPSMPIHRIFCFIGDGLNGKGTYLRLIEKLVGEGNKCASEIELLSNNRFESNKLFKKLVCMIGEVDRGIFKKTKTIKSLTGDDLTRFEFKGKDGFDGHNYAKPLIACNSLPETSDKTKGFYRRWTIVDFPNRFNEKKDILKNIPNEEYSNFCRKALRILPELLRIGEFTNDGSIEQREDKYEKHSNHINEFVKEYCTLNSESYVEFGEFCERYNEYLVSTGNHRKSKIEIGRGIKLKGFQKKVKKMSSGLNSTTKTCIFGIKFIEDYL